MRKLSVFNLITIDGFYAGQGGDISWHKVDSEFNRYAEESANSGNTIIFGRVTYDLMASYWPTEQALKDDPIVAKGMNSAPKVVFSRTLDKVEWSNTRLVKTDMLTEIRRMKLETGKDLVILGSGTIVAQLAQERGLIDEYEILLVPVVIGKGKTMFEGVPERLNLKLTKTRIFQNGNVLLCYEPIA